ncbi:MAG: hypothetical protein ACHQ49_01615 [Elusimicrobiota bacterium]
MPEIKGQVNKESKEKKKGGLLARLFGGGSGGSSGLGGLGGAGGAGGAGGGFAGGGILATKAGLLALILVGTTVAGGIGMLGYRMFGPGADSNGSGDNLSLFAPRPKEAQNAADAGAAKDGNSASLQYLNQANKEVKAPEAAASEAPKDVTAADAANKADASVAKAGAGGPINKMGDTGNGASKNLLKAPAKFGTLTGPGGGGGGGSVASSGAPKGAGDLTPGSKGSMSGFKKGGAASVSGGTARSIAGKKFAGTIGQGFGVLGNQRTAASSAQAGQTYDGAASGGSNIGGGSPIGGGPGVGTGAPGAAQPTTLPGPNTTPNPNNIPTPGMVQDCPWQNAINMTRTLVGLAVALMLVGKLLSKTQYGKMIAMVIAAIVAAMGTMIIGLGAQSPTASTAKSSRAVSWPRPAWG